VAIDLSSGEDAQALRSARSELWWGSGSVSSISTVLSSSGSTSAVDLELGPDGSRFSQIDEHDRSCD
jgi:hypothetical protein